LTHEGTDGDDWNFSNHILIDHILNLLCGLPVKTSDYLNPIHDGHVVVHQDYEEPTAVLALTFLLHDSLHGLLPIAHVHHLEPNGLEVSFRDESDELIVLCAQDRRTTAVQSLRIQ